MRLAFPLFCILFSSCSVEATEEELLVGPAEVEEARVADGVELKVTIRADQIAYARSRLRLRDSSATRRDVYFYDTPQLSLFGQGVVLRGRKTYDGPDDSTVKLRPLSRTSVSASWFRENGFKCETDVVGTRAVESCSLTVEQDRGELDSVAAGSRQIYQLFSNAQEDFLASYGRQNNPWAQLSVLGPTRALIWKLSPQSVREGITAELWTLPNGTAVLELSTKTTRSMQADTAMRFQRWITAQGLDASDDQETKTRIALEYFSSRLR